MRLCITSCVNACGCHFTETPSSGDGPFMAGPCTKFTFL